MTSPAEETPIWTPGAARAARSNMAAFLRHVRERLPGARVTDYRSLREWSVARPDELWPEVWRFCGVLAEPSRSGSTDPWDQVVVGLDRMTPPDPVKGPRWFTGARLNFAENLLRFRDDREALVSWSEQGRRCALTYAELHGEVAAVRRALEHEGIGAGDRVAAWMPNAPQTVIAMLGAASVGAVWSSCSPDFGVRGVLDRFGQIAPRVLVCADGYRYAGKDIDCLSRLRDIVDGLPSVERVVIVPWLREEREVAGLVGGIRGAVLWQRWMARGGPPPIGESTPTSPAEPHRTDARAIEFAPLPFDHPLYIMYSSGTTGLPKCMVHGAGGTLLQHLKEHVLHTDLSRDDRIFYVTTCGWMMWNWLVSALAVGATVVLYDGAPLAPRPGILWEMAEAERITVFGTSAKYLAMCEKEGLAPGRDHDLAALRTILSTGSPLAAHSYDYVYERIGRDIHLASISGGTDIISCFALGNPMAPVWRGELQTLGLGMAVDVWSAGGEPVRGEPGELVCTRPFPSMPVAFWNDPDGSKYRAAYFEHFPGVWRHGDWAELTAHDGLVIHGRSDATLNPGGVRIGTAEIYRQVEQLPEIVESIVVGQDVIVEGERDVRIVLFVRLRDGIALDEALRQAIARRIRENTSPHHVPKRIVQVADIPRTISGKITELAVREVIHGRPVKNVDALANPQALALFRDLPELGD